MSFFNGLDLLVQAATLRSPMDNESTNQTVNYPILPKKRKYNLPINEDSTDKSDLSDGKLVMDIDEEQSKPINLNSTINSSEDQQFFNSTNYDNITTLINASIKKDQSIDSNLADNLNQISFESNNSELITKIRPKRTPKSTSKFESELKKRNTLSKNDNLDEEIKSIVQDIQTTRKKATKTPDELKDEEYILKRKKNNIAAKKSREQKNAKIMQMNRFHDYLNQENRRIKDELFKEIMLMKLVKNKMNKSSDILKAIKQNDNLSIYKKLINFQFDDDENKENQ